MRARAPGRPAPVSFGRPPSPAAVREIHRRLRGRFGPLDPPRWQDPIDELIFTVLSQNTSDVNSARAYTALRARYSSWEAVAEADPEELAAVIRPGGLANIKAPRILAILAAIAARERGSLDLSWLREASTPRARGYLLSLPGVGQKTAACVLAFSLGRPALPVDTHVFRVGRRLGLLDSGTDAARAHAVMEKLVPAPLRIPMHVGMIRLGREVCRAGTPSCPVCPLLSLCPSAQVFLELPRQERRRKSHGPA